jgi:hypothetical protein
MLQKGAVVEVPQMQGFYSSLFIVSKKDGGMINLKSLNEFIVRHHFKMEGIQTVKDLLKSGEWMTKVDLKDACFTIPSHKDHRALLRFMVQEHHYQFTCLPFGLWCAPWVFTKTLKPLLTPL